MAEFGLCISCLSDFLSRAAFSLVYLTLGERTQASVIPAGDWFCCEACTGIRGALMQQVAKGAVPVEGEGLSWQMLRGAGGSEASAATLATATALLQASLDAGLPSCRLGLRAPVGLVCA